VKLPRQSFSTEPVHLRLAGLCRSAIEKGDFAPGEKFPSERELADRYEVSRATANKVIATLVAEGLLELRKGLGTRVRKRRTLFASLDGMESFTEHARAQGLEPATEVITFERVLSGSLSPEVKAGLGLDGAESEEIVYLERLRLADGVPLILEHRWVRETLAPGLSREDVAASFYRVLEEKFGLSMTGERHSISAVLLDGESADLFGLNEPAVALLVEGAGFIRGETPLWYQRLLYRGDRYRLDNETRGAATSAVGLRLGSEKQTA